MGWRDALKVEPLPQKPQKPQKGSDAGAFVPFVPFVPGNEKENEPMPQDVGDFGADVDAVVADLNRLWADVGCEMSDIPIEQRRRAGALDQDMTEAANRGDLQRARAALREWRACWVPPDVNMQQGQD